MTNPDEPPKSGTVGELWGNVKDRIAKLPAVPFTVLVFLLAIFVLIGLRYYVDASLELENGGISIARIGRNQYRRTVHASEGVVDTGIQVKKGDHVVIKASGRTSTSVSAYHDLIGMLWVYSQWEILSYCSRPEIDCNRTGLKKCGKWAEKVKQWTTELDNDWKLKRDCAKEFDGFRLTKGTTMGKKSQSNEWTPLSGKFTFLQIADLAKEADQLFNHLPADADGEQVAYSKAPLPARDGRPFPHYEDDDGMHCPSPHGRLIAWVCEGQSPSLCAPKRDPKRCAHSGKAMDFIVEQDGRLWVVVNDSTRFAASNTGLLVLEVSIDKKWYLQFWKPGL